MDKIPAKDVIELGKLINERNSYYEGSEYHDIYDKKVKAKLKELGVESIEPSEDAK